MPAPCICFRLRFPTCISCRLRGVTRCCSPSITYYLLSAFIRPLYHNTTYLPPILCAMHTMRMTCCFAVGGRFSAPNAFATRMRIRVGVPTAFCSLLCRVLPLDGILLLPVPPSASPTYHLITRWVPRRFVAFATCALNGCLLLLYISLRAPCRLSL